MDHINRIIDLIYYAAEYVATSTNSEILGSVILILATAGKFVWVFNRPAPDEAFVRLQERVERELTRPLNPNRSAYEQNVGGTDDEDDDVAS